MASSSQGGDTTSGPLHGLPAQPTPLIGRAREVGEIGTKLRGADVRLLALLGPAGVGKTRLAIEAALPTAADFSDGMFFIDLSPLSDPALVLPTIARALGIGEDSDRPLLDRVKTHLADRQALLVLDNFEQ